jgi:hypothetical protein
MCFCPLRLSTLPLVSIWMESDVGCRVQGLQERSLELLQNLYSELNTVHEAHVQIQRKNLELDASNQRYQKLF